VIPTKITASLSTGDNGNTTLTVLRTDGLGVVNHTRWDLHTIEREGFDAACLQVGNIVLRLLAETQPVEFSSYLPLVPPPALPWRGIMLTLIDKTIRDGTSDHVATIDALLARHGADAELASTTIPSNWPAIRKALTIYHTLTRSTPDTDAEPPQEPS
jgi:hypothetical protein